MNVAVVGLGYVGCVTAACLARLGHTVIGVDRDRQKVANVNSGLPPFFEPGLAEIIAAARSAGLLSATDSMAEALAPAGVALLCVGTPSAANGDISLEQLRRVATEIKPLLDGRLRPLIITVRSTAFPGTCAHIFEEALARHPMCRVVSNPEFLREGCAVKDFLEPSLLVVGGDDQDAVRKVASLYEGLPVEPTLTSLRAAEMIKYACNAFHAVKIAFANEIGSLAALLQVDGEEVMNTLCRDDKLNLSAAYLRPGFAFGGSCLPKDLRAITYRSLRLDLKLPLLENILASNEEHLRRAIDASLGFGAGTVGIYGLAFKENTDDLRESPVVALIEQMIGKGRNLVIYDPHVRIDEIYGSNKQFLLSALPHIGRLLADDLPALLRSAQRVIVAQKPAPSDVQLIRKSGLPLLDLTHVVTRAAAAHAD